MEYRINDQRLTAAVFIAFANQIWQGDYDRKKLPQPYPKPRTSPLMMVINWLDVCGFFRTVIFLEPLQNFWSYQTTRSRALAANCWSLPENTPLLCCILAHSQGWNLFMKKMAVRKACNLI